jgi:TetR/AcrR family transcriptional regulator
MARIRNPGYEEQREAILAQAARLFAQRGYPATSMNQVAEACGLSKPTLYHYYRDKYALLVSIAEGHVAKLEGLISDVAATGLPPEEALRELIRRFVAEYAHAQDAHRVLTEDVRFLVDEDRERVLEKERRLVEGFARVLGRLRPDGALDHGAMAPIVADLFLGGVPAVRLPGTKLPEHP